MRYFLLSCTIILSSWTVPVQAQGNRGEYLRTNPQFLLNFREVTQKVSPVLVRVQCDGKDTALGVIVASDGWILTKAHDLRGKITCILKNGQVYEAHLIGVHEANDLAMLRISARSLSVIQWHHSDHVRAGSWVVSVGLSEEPVAVGVVSVPTRNVHEAHLGVQVDNAPEGLIVLNIMQKSAALKAGIRPRDVLLRVNGQSFTDMEAFAQFLAGHRPGDTLNLTIRRGKKDFETKATLLNREQGGDFRAEFQNRLGSELSQRRSGYAVILQHDSILKPGDCGSPLVDLQGRVVGFNISRAGRVESWAIPSEVVQPLIAELKSGRYPRSERRSDD